MTSIKSGVNFNPKASRHWTLYVIRLNDGCYYIGITSYKDFMRRINQHGGPKGACVNRGKTVEEIIEIHPLGRMSGERAGRIENNMTLEYRRKFGFFGFLKVRGGYDVWVFKYPGMRFIPTFTPGSTQSLIFILCCLLLAALLLMLVTTP